MSGTNRFLVKFNRYIAYILIPVTLFMLMSGFRMTGNFSFIPRGLADLLHRVYVHSAFLVLFIIHVVLSARIALMRRHVRGLWLDILLAVVGLAVIVYFSYLSQRLILPWGR